MKHRRDLFSPSSTVPFTSSKSTPTNHVPRPSLHAYNDTCTTDWCVTGAISGSFLKHQHFAAVDSATWAHLLIFPQLMLLCMCVWTVSLLLVSLSDFNAPGRPLPVLVFSFTLREGHLHRQGKRKTGRNKSEGGKDSGEWRNRAESRAESRTKKQAVKKEWVTVVERGAARNR